MAVNARLMKRLPMPSVFVAVNYNEGTLHSFPTYSFASRGAIRLVRNGADPFLCLYSLGKYPGSRAKCLGRFGRFPTMDYDPNQCWGKFTSWEDDQPFEPKDNQKIRRSRYRVSIDPVEPPPAYQMETPVDDAFVSETPTRFSFYVDRRELLVRPVLITGRSEDQVQFDWPACGGWGRGAVDNERYFHGTAEWAMDQLLEFMATEGNLKPWMGGESKDA